MRSRSVAFSLAVVLVSALAGSAGCANMTRNQKQGIAVVGGVAMVVGSTVMIDGWSCDEANWGNGTCDHDRGELIKGGTTFAVGGALLTWALVKLAGDEPAAAETTRTASKTRNGVR